ncbi:MAG: HAMP domain-containing histidine kinase [Clostridia bacterium]|nr:HAMP domain-containing histidine kinase [Clostridia bacterium]
MITRIRSKFMRIAAVTLTVAMVLLTVVVNGVNRYFVYRELLSTTGAILDNGGRIPNPQRRMDRGRRRTGRRAEGPVDYETRYFSVLGQDGAYAALDLEHISSVEEEDAVALVREAENSGRKSGYLEDFFWSRTETADGGTVYCFLDAGVRLESMRALLVISAAVCAAFIALALLFAAAISRRAIQPMLDNIARQKQFITDAGHELKTPLTVMSADLDLLEMDAGENEWTQGIRRQVGRMRKLVSELVTLSRLDEEQSGAPAAEFDLSQAARETAEGFGMMAEAAGKTLEARIDDGLSMRGDESAVRRLLSVLLDNAVKYAADGTQIVFSAARDGKRIRIETANRILEPLDKDSLDRLFDRFYRADASRSQEGGRTGYGIGLAIARAVAEKHGGTIEAKQEGNEIRFVCALPGKPGHSR